MEQVQLFKAKLDALRQTEMDISDRKNVVSSRLQEITSVLVNFESESDQINVAKTEEKRASIISQINAANQTIGAAKQQLRLAMSALLILRPTNCCFAENE